MLGVFAEFEGSIIQERVRAGLVLELERRGTTLGRSRTDAMTEDRIRALAAQGYGKGLASQ